MTPALRAGSYRPPTGDERPPAFAACTFSGAPLSPAARRLSGTSGETQGALQRTGLADVELLLAGASAPCSGATRLCIQISDLWSAQLETAKARLHWAAV
eukprot:scaffold46026_cov47-Phaeocystis_antarctica.AAC.7